MLGDHPFVPYQLSYVDQDSMGKLTKAHFAKMNARRTVRHFSEEPIRREIIEDLLQTASTAPSGANKQPWSFCAVSDPVMKRKIRRAAEEEEKKNYGGRMSEEWLEDLAKFGTDENKPNLEAAPWLIVVFKKAYDLIDGVKTKNYYVNESVGLACGFLISAIHQAGLAALTHTPSPMNFLEKVLDRPSNERAFLLIPVGYPAKDAQVPDISRKAIGEISTFYE